MLIAGVLLVAGGHSLAAHLESFTAHLHALGAWGVALFIAGYAIASAAFVPAGLLTMTAGALFGIPAGIAYAFLGASLGAIVAFLLSRYAARGAVEHWLTRYPRLSLLGASVGEHGRRIVTLLRLSPVIPFSAINVAMGGSHTLNELVETLNHLLGTSLEPVYSDERPGDVPESMADVSLARELLRYDPRVDFVEGLRRTIDWISSTRSGIAVGR
jgi:hypothetical protein